MQKLWQDFTNLIVRKMLKFGKGALIRVTNASGTVNTFRASSLVKSQAAPETATDSASLSDAQMLAGLLVATPTAAAAYTVRTGAQIEAALLAAGYEMQNDDYFDLTIINLGGTTDDITMTVAAGVTFVGEVVLRPGADTATEHGGQGTWRFRRTAAETFVGYRVG